MSGKIKQADPIQLAMLKSRRQEVLDRLDDSLIGHKQFSWPELLAESQMIDVDLRDGQLARACEQAGI